MRAVVSVVSNRRLLLVHAHPDDETLTTGATMARCAARGDRVTLVTCTLGDEGEVIPPELAHLTSDRDDALGPHRARELAEAMVALGVRDHRLLAGGRWRDSGMAWLAPGRAGAALDEGQLHPRAFVRAPVDEAAAELAAVLRETRPQVVVTYDPQGGYGHPDHVHAHRVTMRAVELAQLAGGECDGWQVDRVFWVQVARSWAVREREVVLVAAASGQLPVPLQPPPARSPFAPAVLDDDQLSCVVDAPEQLAAKVAALRAHATQVRVDEPWFALSNDVAQVLTAREGFRLAPGAPVSGAPLSGGGVQFDDLFAGLAGDHGAAVTDDAGIIDNSCHQ